MFCVWPAKPKPVTSVMARACWRKMRDASFWLLHICANAFSTSAPRDAPAMCPAIKTPLPMGLVSTKTSPGLAPDNVIRSASHNPVTERPMVISQPKVLCPPTMSAPASVTTSETLSRMSCIERSASASDICGSVTDTTTACGSAPIAQTSPKAWWAVMRAITSASVQKLRKWSVVKTCRA